MKKILVSLIIVCLLVTCVYSLYTVKADNFSLTEHEDDKSDYEFAKSTVRVTGIIYDFLRYVGIGIALISLVLIAIKYLYSSPGEKADYKKNLIVFVIGGVGMFSVGSILKIIQNLSEQVGV